MVKNVVQILKKLIMDKPKTDEATANKYLKKTDRYKRYKADVWSWAEW